MEEKNFMCRLKFTTPKFLISAIIPLLFLFQPHAQAKSEKKRNELEAELEKYQQMVRELRTSKESRLTVTQKQKVYHKKIVSIKAKIVTNSVTN